MEVFGHMCGGGIKEQIAALLEGFVCTWDTCVE